MIVRRANRLLAALVALVPLAMTVVTCLDVIGRRFDKPLPGAIEMIELLMGVLVFGALPLVTADREHVTVGLVDHWLRRSALRWRDAVVALLSAAVVGVIAWRLFVKAAETAAYGDRSTYLGLPMAGLAYFMAATAALTALLLLFQVSDQREPPR